MRHRTRERADGQAVTGRLPARSARLGWPAVVLAVAGAIWLHPAPAGGDTGEARAPLSAATMAIETTTPNSVAPKLPAPDPSTPDPPAAEVIRRLTGPEPASAVRALPTDFARVMGYWPGDDAGYPVNPRGGCSSPVRMPASFEELCRSHDFGYDVLRYAQRTGHPLGAWARLSLDRMLVDRMTRSCADAKCAVWAELARTGVGVNTWREGDGPPGVGGSPLEIARTTAHRVITDIAGRLTGRR